ncbi:uncharacterized protein [Watersipora subatra]|uniref:uncharacterized protein n=1 Tax=Watersipora subatra TaxID=2589382 RepID=UPI00355B38F4
MEDEREPGENKAYWIPDDTPWNSIAPDMRVATGLLDKDSGVQIAILLYTMGGDAEQLYETFTFADDNEKKDFYIVSKKLMDYFNPKRNVIYLRNIFHTKAQRADESIEGFIRDLYKLSEHCEFAAERYNTIRDRLVVGLLDKELSAKLQLEENLDLSKAIYMSRHHELVKSEVAKQVEIDSISRSSASCGTSQKNSDRPAVTKLYANYQEAINCNNCGLKHKRRQCPAFGKQCHHCQQPNHFAKKCRSRARLTPAAAEIVDQNMPEGET